MATLRDLGDISIGRPQLGENMPVMVYRLFEMAIMAVLTEEFGRERSDELVRTAGHMAGLHFAEKNLSKELPFHDFVSQLQEALAGLKIGILRVERTDFDQGKIQLSVYEDLDCSGLPVTDEQVCVYDEGFLSGILEYYTDAPFEVREIDCWASGERVCRFKAERQ